MYHKGVALDNTHDTVKANEWYLQALRKDPALLIAAINIAAVQASGRSLRLPRRRKARGPGSGQAHVHLRAAQPRLGI